MDLLEKYKGVYQTIFSDGNRDQEFKYVDSFSGYLNELIKYYETIPYKSIPHLADFFLDGLYLFEKASDREKRMMFHSVLNRFELAMRRLRTRSDQLWSEEKQNFFLE